MAFVEGNSKIGLRQAVDQSCAIIINHQFWAPCENGEGDRPRKVQFLELQMPRDLDFDLGSGRGHTGAYMWSRSTHTPTTITTTVLWPFVWDYPGEPVPEETLTHPPSWSSSSLYQLLPSITIHSILPVQITCLAIFMHNLCLCPLWSTSWTGALHVIFHAFLHPIIVFFSQHMPIPSQPVLL